MQEYPDVGQKIKIRTVISGNEILLEDGSRWRILPISPAVLEWKEGDTLHIKPSGYDRVYSYLLANQDKEITLRGLFIGFDKEMKNRG